MKTSYVRTFLTSIFWILTLSASNVSHSQIQVGDLEIFPAAVSGKADNNQGVLLIEIEVGGVAPAIEIVRLTSDEDKRFNTELTISSRSRSTKIQLKGLENGLYYGYLPKGTYQITKVYAPSFDLPFYVDTELDNRWRFHITEKRTNYVGTLLIAAERSYQSVNVKLINLSLIHI